MRPVFGNPVKTHEYHVPGDGKIDQDAIILLDLIPVFPPCTFGKVLMFEVAAIPTLLRLFAVTFHCLPDSHSKIPLIRSAPCCGALTFYSFLNGRAPSAV